MSELLDKINGHMHEGRCPTSGCIGECAAIDETAPGDWWAALYIWDNEFNDSTRVAQWFYDAGATDVLIRHVLHDSVNDDRDGRCFDGVRAWHVEFRIPPAPCDHEWKWHQMAGEGQICEKCGARNYDCDD